MKVKLLPPFLLGRYFQALAIYLSEELEILEYGIDYIEIEDESFERATEELIDKVEKHMEKGQSQLTSLR